MDMASHISFGLESKQFLSSMLKLNVTGLVHPQGVGQSVGRGQEDGGGCGCGQWQRVGDQAYD